MNKSLETIKKIFKQMNKSLENFRKIIIRNYILSMSIKEDLIFF